MSYLALNIIRYLFAVLVPIWFAVVLVCQVLKTRRCFGREGSSLLRLCWIIELGLLCCLLLRCAIVAFMSVAAFNDVEDIMYLSSAHPILLLYLLIGSFTFPFIQNSSTAWRPKQRASGTGSPSAIRRTISSACWVLILRTRRRSECSTASRLIQTLCPQLTAT